MWKKLRFMGFRWVAPTYVPQEFQEEKLETEGKSGKATLLKQEEMRKVF